MANNISEKTKLELALKESEEGYRGLFENAIDVMYVNDAEGYILNVNKAGLKMLGCSAEDVIGTHVSRWFTPESFRLTQETVRKRIMGEPADDPMVRQIVTKSGECRWVEIKRRLIKDGNKLIAVHGIGRDITENRRLKQELKESNKQLRLLRYLMEGTRGGNTRALILKHLNERPYNANQLAEALNLDYKTVRHHLDVLLKNGIVTKESDGCTVIYFLSKIMEVKFK